MPANPFLLALFARAAETYLPGIPIWMQKVGFGLGCTLARLLGYGRGFASYVSESYAGDETEEAAARAA